MTTISTVRHKPTNRTFIVTAKDNAVNIVGYQLDLPVDELEVVMAANVIRHLILDRQGLSAIAEVAS